MMDCSWNTYYNRLFYSNYAQRNTFNEFCNTFFRWVPESCRWNLLHNRETKAKETLTMIAKLNGKDGSSGQFDLVVEKEEKQAEEPGGILDLFRPKQQLVQTIVLWIAW